MTIYRRGWSIFLPLLGFLSIAATITRTWQLIDRFKDVSVGDWVKLSYSGGSEHLLLVAARDDSTITLEEKVLERSYLTGWTQIVVDMKKKLPVLVRERLPGGEIVETEITDQDSVLDEDFQALLTAQFSEEPETERVIVPAGRFYCKVYRAVYNKKLIRIFFSEKIPLYPVKVLIPNYQLTIRLLEFGKGKESNFVPAGQKLPRGSPDRIPGEEKRPVPSESAEAGCSRPNS